MTTQATTDTEGRAEVRHNEEKWTKTLMKAGWICLPDVIIERQNVLGLNSVDVNVLMHLVRRWWTAGNLPHPGMKDIATRMGVSLSVVQRSLRRMRDDGLIEIHPRKDGRGQTTNEYSFKGLIKKVTPYAEETLNARAKEKERSTRKGPPLRIVASTGRKGRKV